MPPIPSDPSHGSIPRDLVGSGGRSHGSQSCGRGFDPRGSRLTYFLIFLILPPNMPKSGSSSKIQYIYQICPSQGAASNSAASISNPLSQVAVIKFWGRTKSHKVRSTIRGPVYRLNLPKSGSYLAFRSQYLIRQSQGNNSTDYIYTKYGQVS